MMMITDRGLAVSIPHAELAKISLSGSLFTSDLLVSSSISDELRAAVDLLVATCLQQGNPLRFIARPEIFCEGETLAWLTERLDGIEDHVSLSDGTSISIIPKLRNHVFLYGQHRGNDHLAIERLAHRVPEFLTTLSSQINTALAFKAKNRCILLPSSYLEGGTSTTIRAPDLRRFYVNRNSIDDTINRINLFPEVSLDALSEFSRAFYVILTETSLMSSDFRDLLAALVTRTYFQPDTCLIMRLAPNVSSHAESDPMRYLLSAMLESQIAIPRIPANNIFMTNSDIDHEAISAFPRIDLLTHCSSDLWRYTTDFYKSFAKVSVCYGDGNVNFGEFIRLLNVLIAREFHVVQLGFTPISQLISI